MRSGSMFRQLLLSVCLIASGSCTSDSGGASTLSVSTSDRVAVAVRTGICQHLEPEETVEIFLYHQGITVPTPKAQWIQSTLDCVNAASDCPGVLACQGIDVDAPCDVTADNQLCSGTEVVSCERTDGCIGWVQTVDCASGYGEGEGDQCLMSQWDWPSCAVGTCEGSSSVCDGDTLERCRDGVMQRLDCGAYGATCDTETELDFEGREMSSADCVFDQLETCTRPSCDGDMMTLCEDGRVIGTLSCPEMGEGATCVEETDGQPRCRDLSGEQCTHGEVLCAGTEAKWCVDGLWLGVDCSVFLDGTCTVEQDDWSNRVYCISESWNATVDALDGQEGNVWSTCGG